MPEPRVVTRYDPFEGGLSLSLATRAGNLVFTSGMIGVDAEFNVPDDVEEEFRLVFSTLGRILEAMGTSLQHVTEMTNLFVGDFDAVYPMFNKVRAPRCSGRTSLRARVSGSPSCCIRQRTST